METENPQGRSRYDLPLGSSRELTTWAQRRWEEGDKRRPSWTPQLSLAFYHGNHYVTRDTGNGRLRRYRNTTGDPNAPVLLSAPLIQDRIDRVIAKLLKTAPVPECRPVATEADDRAAAKVGSRLLAHEWERLDMESKLSQLYSWVVPVGWSYLQITWNPKDGEGIGNGLHVGQINIDVVPYAEISMNADATGPHNARWLIRRVGLSPEEVWARWDKEVPVGKDNPSGRTLGQDLLDMKEPGVTRPNVGQVDVYQLWVPPGAYRSAPNGLTVTWSGDTILSEAVPFPYKHGHMPLVQYNFLAPQGSAYGRSVVPDCIPLQMDYNDAKSRMAFLRRVLVPHLFHANGQIDPNKMTTRSVMVPYNEGYGDAPRWDIPGGQWMQQYVEAMARAEQEMDARFGLEDATTGNLPGTSAAATAISQQELADEPRVVPQQQLSRAIKETGWQVLELVRQFWREKRIVRTYSEAGTLEVRRFSRADIKNEMDVHVRKESALPRSKAGRAQMFIEFVKNGLLPNDGALLANLLDLPPTDVLSLEFNRQVRKQEREIGQMVDDGFLAQVDPLSDDHNQHMSVLENFMQEPDWEDLDDYHRDLVRSHWFGHASLLVQKMMSGVDPKMGMLMGGQPPPGEPGQIQQGTGPAGIAGQPGQAPPPTPGITDIARMGGLTGRPGDVRGVTDDMAAAAVGE